MSRLISVAALLLCVSIGTASHPVVAQGASEQASTTLPDGPGRALVAAQCTSCHSLDEALSKRTTTDRWLATVQQMVDLGAPVTAPDAATISSYLGHYFGLGAPAETQTPPQALTQPSALPDGPGREVLTRKCFQCHQMSMWSGIRQDRAAWESVLYRMIGRGARWTTDEIDAMAGYLEQVRGPMPAEQSQS